nr:hypothetical protein [uncultured Cohaesibacter sp.]
MAVTNEENRWEGVGDGYSTSFPIGANFDYDADIKVYVDGAYQAEGYQISGAGGINGGAVVFDVAPVDGAVVVSLLDPALVQKRDLPNAGGGAAALNLIERAMDRLTRITQVMTSRIMRGLQLPDGGIDGESFFDARGNRIGNVADPENDSDAVPKSYIGKQVVAVNEAAQTAVDNAVQTGNDAKATAADRLQTGLDREAAAESAELAQQAQPIAITEEGRILVAQETASGMKTQLGLENVDNTPDAEKPISTAVQSALNGKLPTDGKAADSNQLDGKNASEYITVIAILEDQKPSGVDGQVGSTSWYVRHLNTEVADPNGLVTLVSNEFTVSKDCSAIITSPGRDLSQYRLWNVTDDTAATGVTYSYSGGGYTFPNTFFAYLSAGKKYRVEQKDNNVLSNVNASGAGVEVYTRVLLIG